MRAGGRVPADESSRGLFAGLRYVLRDKLLGPMMGAAAFINFAAQGLIAMLPVLVVRRFDENPKILGFFFAAFGAGALLGSLVAAQVVRKVTLLEARGCRDRRDGGPAVAARARPALARGRPGACRLRVLRAARERADHRDPDRAYARCAAPEGADGRDDDRSVIGPLGFLAVGLALQHVGMTVVFLAIAAGFSAGALAFSAAVNRGGAEEEAQAGPASDLAPVLQVEAWRGLVRRGTGRSPAPERAAVDLGARDVLRDGANGAFSFAS